MSLSEEHLKIIAKDTNKKYRISLHKYNKPLRLPGIMRDGHIFVLTGNVCVFKNEMTIVLRENEFCRFPTEHYIYEYSDNTQIIKMWLYDDS